MDIIEKYERRKQIAKHNKIGVKKPVKKDYISYVIDMSW